MRPTSDRSIAIFSDHGLVKVRGQKSASS